MSSYVILTDGFVDIPREKLEEWGVKMIPSHLRFEGEETDHPSDELNAAQFYARLRSGERAGTAAVNIGEFEEIFEALVKQGQDVLFLGFSGGLSSTCSNAVTAAGELAERYPARRIVCVDTLLASTGYGMLVSLVAEQCRSGASLEEAAAFAEQNRQRVCSWFTVEDMSSLVRGGRVATVIASLGGRLNLRPVLHVDNAGHLIPVMVSRGRKKSIMALADQYGRLAEVPGSAPVFINQGDCLEDAEYLARLLTEHYGVTPELITDCGPAIGAHTGAGVLGLFFLGKER